MTLNENPPAFKLGLCLAGAASGGCYSAGVLDFLLEALFEWDQAKKAGEAVPGWNVDISDMVGSSAGGITATIAIAALNTAHEPLPREWKVGDKSPNNGLFKIWVDEMNVDNLFDTRDLQHGESVQSMLYGGFMQETADSILNEPQVEGGLPEFARDTRLYLTATNMRGVPYSIKHFMTAVDDEKFYMRRYADYSGFQVVSNASEVDEDVKRRMFVLNVDEARSSDGWKKAIVCSRASSAFPGAFSTVMMETPVSHYENRLEVEPDWEANPTKESNVQVQPMYQYAAVDGGTLNNEPFGLLERKMEARYMKKLDSGGDTCWGSVVMIDPFPGKDEDSKVTAAGGLGILPMMSSLMAAVRGEAMFKEKEFGVAATKFRMEKFMIRPEREVLASQKYALATATVEGFGGILDYGVRIHDFLLGRKNCQYFLREAFTIERENAEQNPIFAPFKEFLDRDEVPIVPLVGSAALPVQDPEWPTFSKEVREEKIGYVLEKIRGRLRPIISIAMENMGITRRTEWYELGQKTLNLAAGVVGDRVFERMSDSVRASLEEAMSVYVDK